MREPSSYLERIFYQQKPYSYLGAAYVFGYIGFGCLIVGIIGDALNRVPGLEPASWFLAAIGFLILGLWHWLEWTHVKKKE